MLRTKLFGYLTAPHIIIATNVAMRVHGVRYENRVLTEIGKKTKWYGNCRAYLLVSLNFWTAL